MKRHHLRKNLHFKTIKPDQNRLFSFKYLGDFPRYFLYKIRQSYFFISCFKSNNIMFASISFVFPGSINNQFPSLKFVNTTAASSDVKPGRIRTDTT